METEEILRELNGIAMAYNSGVGPQSYEELVNEQKEYLSGQLDPDYDCGDSHFECVYHLENGDRIVSQGGMSGYLWTKA